MCLFDEFISEGLGRKDFDFGALGAELLDEVQSRCEVPFEDARFYFALRGMERQGADEGRCVLGETYTDEFGLVAAEDTVTMREILLRIEVLWQFEGLVGDLEFLNAVEGVDTGCRRSVHHEAFVQFALSTEDVPALFEDLEAVRCEVELVRCVGVETLVGDMEPLTVVHCIDDGGEILGAFRDGFVEDTVAQFAAGVEGLTDGELGEQPLHRLAGEVRFGDIVMSGGSVTLDIDVEERPDLVDVTMEGAFRVFGFFLLVGG